VIAHVRGPCRIRPPAARNENVGLDRIAAPHRRERAAIGPNGASAPPSAAPAREAPHAQPRRGAADSPVGDQRAGVVDPLRLEGHGGLERLLHPRSAVRALVADRRASPFGDFARVDDRQRGAGSGPGRAAALGAQTACADEGR
jgi:hypothetical protein